MWRNSSSINKPAETEVGLSTVYFRKDFVFVEAVESEDDMHSEPAHWEYKELEIDKALYPVYEELKQKNDTLETTIAEQDELLAMLLLGE